MKDFSWLNARPIAHRGLHDAAAGRIENTMSAFAAAAERRFNIELDVHMSADGQIYVFHDDVLDRLTEVTGPVAGKSYADLRAIAIKGTGDRMPLLSEVLDVVAGRVGLVIEIKSYFAERQRDLVEATAKVLSTYGGPFVLESFDPRQVQDVGEIAPDVPRGIIADDCSTPDDYNDFRFVGRNELLSLEHHAWSGFEFLSYWVRLLGNEPSRKVRDDWKLPVTTWTVRTPDDVRAARDFGAEIVFEGFDPETV